VQLKGFSSERALEESAATTTSQSKHDHSEHVAMVEMEELWGNEVQDIEVVWMV
jgi:hypothetical protein